MTAGSYHRKSCLSSSTRSAGSFSGADVSNRSERVSEASFDPYARAYRSRLRVRWESDTYEHVDRQVPAKSQPPSFSFDSLAIRSSNTCATLLHESVRSCLPSKFQRAPKASPSSFEILRCKDQRKGLGMFSRRKIPMGGLIEVETPAVIAHVDTTALGMSTTSMHTTLFHLLTPDTLKRITGLSSSQSLRGPPSFEGIMKNNAFIVDLKANNKKRQAHQALFLNASRCNHSCSPNATWTWNKDTFTLSLVAARPIAVGEEITISYVDATLSREHRQERLLKRYQFHCECVACTSKWTPTSDRNRAELHNFWNKTCSFDDWCLNPKLPGDYLIEMHERALDLREEEGLQLLDYQKHADAIALCYGALSDRNMFQQWIAHAMSCRADSDRDHVLLMQVWHEQPTSFSVWGWRSDSTGL